MEIAKVQVSGSSCTPVQVETITKGLVGATVAIEYTDSVWDNLRKTVVFRSYTTKDVLDAGDEVIVPAEVVARAGVQLYMGVYGVDADGAVVIPTIWASLGMVRGAASPSGDSSTDPSLPVWAQIQAMIGNLDELDTTAKSNLVDAVNEALLSGGGTVSPEAVQRIVDDYLKANPPAPGKDGKDGVDGITPTIGSNGNWYLGNTDTGKPSRGEKGESVNSKPFVVTVIFSSKEYTSDKTFQEILNAYNDGAQVNARIVGYPGVAEPSTLPLFVYTGQQFLFSGAGIANGPITMTARCGQSGWEVALMSLVDAEDIPGSLPNPYGLTIKVGGAVTEYDGSSVQTVEIPTASGGETWELIKAITIPEGAEESNALTISTDENGDTFSLKKAKIFGYFPKYTGTSTVPNFSFFALNGVTVGANAPYCYTGGLITPSTALERTCSVEVDLTLAGIQRELVFWTTTGGKDYFGAARISTVTSIGGTQMLIYPGCKFWLYGVRA